MRRRSLFTAASVGALGSGAVATAARAAYTTTVAPGTSWGTWEGWGTSLAWWGKAFGNRNDLADIMFTRSSVNFGGSRFGTVPDGTVTRWSTQTNGSQRYQRFTDTQVSSKRFSRAFPANTVQTFEIEGVVL